MYGTLNIHVRSAVFCLKAFRLRKIKKEKVQGFDFMDKSGIEPIPKLVQQFQADETASPKIHQPVAE
jgi:hypothetical protein